MYYVYSKYTGKSQKIDFLGTFDTEYEAIKKIASCYAIDKRLSQLGEYYYFYSKH